MSVEKMVQDLIKKGKVNEVELNLRIQKEQAKNPVPNMQKDVQEVAEMVSISLEDSFILGEMLGMVMEEVAMLREEIELLKGGE